MERYKYCIRCGETTGEVGKEDDSFYCLDMGPFCEACYDLMITKREGR